MFYLLFYIIVQIILQAGLDTFVDRIRPAGRMFDIPDLDRPGTYVRILFMEHYHPKPPPAQTNSALCAHRHLSVDQQLPDRQAAASEVGKIHINHLYDLPTALLSLHKWLHI